MSFFEQIKSLYKHASIISIAIVLQKAVGFIMLPIYAHYLRGEGYGIIGLLGVMTSMMTVFIGYGMKGAIQRYYFLEEDDLSKKKMVSTGIFVLALLSISLSVPTLFGSKVISWLLFGKPDYYLYVILASITFIANMTAQGGEAYIFITKQIYFWSLLALIRFVITVALNIYLVVFRKMGVLGVLYSNLATAMLFSIALNLKSLINVGLHFDWQAAKNILKYNIPMIPGYIAMFVRSNVDKIILRSFLGIEVLGVYLMLLKLASLMRVLITTPFLKIWSVKRLEICDQKNGSDVIARVFSVQTSLVLFFALILAVEIPSILKLLTPKEFWVPNFYAILAVLQPIMISCYYHFNFGIIYSRLTFEISKIQFVTASLSCIANYIFIKQFGLLGALTAGVLIYSCQLIITHLFARKHYFIPFAWSQISKAFSGFVVLFFIIDAFTIRHFDFAIKFANNLKSTLINWIELFPIASDKINEKLLYMIENLEIILDIIIKFGFSFSFIILLYFIGIIPNIRIKEMIRLAFNKKSAKSSTI
jgi:O-antigen/teichoic acid export membrane protein